MSSLVITAIILVVVGFGIGVLGGLLGIGGGTIIVPVLRIAFGLEAVVSTATSLFTIIFTSVGGTVTHLRNKTCIPKLGVAMGVGGAVTSALGVFLSSKSPSWAVMLVAAIIIVYSGYNMLKKAIKLPKKGAAPAPKQQASAPADGGDFAVTGKVLAKGFCIGLIAGLGSGYVGVGGGFIMVPLMTSWLCVPMKKASGTSLVAIMILAIPGVIENIMMGNVDFLAGICLVVGSIPGAMFGARFVKRIPERQLRFIFAGFLLVAAVMLMVKEFVL